MRYRMMLNSKGLRNWEQYNVMQELYRYKPRLETDSVHNSIFPLCHVNEPAPACFEINNIFRKAVTAVNYFGFLSFMP